VYLDYKCNALLHPDYNWCEFFSSHVEIVMFNQENFTMFVFERLISSSVI
jgi:hypothetical protein